MYSSNDKLIDEIKKRLLTIRKNNPISFHRQSGVRYLEVRRISTLIPRKGSDSRKSSLLPKNFLTEDKINLRLVPVIKSEKAIMKLSKDNIRAFKTEHNKDPYYERNKLVLKRSKKNNNNNSNLYIKTFSNILSNSNSIGKIKTITKKNLFLSPFQISKNRKKIFKNLVNFSKEIHSPQHKEKILLTMKDNPKIRSFKKISDNNLQKSQKIFSPNLTLKKFKIKNNFMNETNDEKNNEKKDSNHINYLLKGLNNCNDIMRNIFNNKRKKLKPNCYYNKLHLNKIKSIIEKYSYNNIE